MPSRVWRPHKSPHSPAYWQLEDFATIRKEMAPQVGLEPTTLRLTAGCSAIELLRSVVRRRKRPRPLNCRDHHNTPGPL